MSNFTNSSVVPDTSFDNLYPALVECFVIILSGYVAGRLSLISPTESKGLNVFVGTFSLPALIFLSMATLDFSVVNWTFLLSIGVAKTLVFSAVALVSLAVTRPKDLAKIGLYGIFTTQSNDFALGYPIVAALYQQSHPEYPGYLYLLAPISLVILNPIGFVLMELEKRRRSDFVCPGRGQVALHIARDVLGNPIVLMTLAGIVGNLVFHHTLPAILAGVLRALGSAFSATALFCLGLKMVGQMQNLSGKTLVVPGILIAVKLLVLPLVTRECVNLFRAGATHNETLSLSTYGFLYGTFPTAPSVFVYASHYNLDMDLIATSMVACTFFSAPLMFVSAKMVLLNVTKDADYLPDLTKFLMNVSIIGIIACVWTFGVFVLSKKWRRMPHFMTLCLLVSQLVACIGAILFATLEWHEDWHFYLQFVVFTFGVMSSRVWTAILAVTLLMLRWRGLCFVLRIRPALALVGWGLPAGLVVILAVLARREGIVKEKVDPNFQYGRTQATTACLVQFGSFLVTAVALILHQRHVSRHPPTASSSDGDETEYRSLLRKHDSSSSSRRNNDDSDAEDQRNLLAHCTVGINGDLVAPGVTTSEDDEEEEVDACRPLAAPPTVAINSQFTVCQGSGCQVNREDNKSSCCLQDVEDICFNTENSPSIVTPQESPSEELCSSKYGCSSTQRHRCSAVVRQYQSLTEPDEPELAMARRREDKSQLQRHVVLLLMLLVSMIVGFALCMWKLVMEETSGIYVELEFLDGALNFGQGLFVFAFFGLDGKLIVLPLVKRWRKFWYGAETVVLPSEQDLPQETRKICEQFMKYHYKKCIKDLVRDHIWRLKHFRQVFRGNELVDWLLMVGLVHDRSEAVAYGRHLVAGRVVRHVDRQHHFHDLPYFYVLIPAETRQSLP